MFFRCACYLLARVTKRGPTLALAAYFSELKIFQSSLLPLHILKYHILEYIVVNIFGSLSVGIKRFHNIKHLRLHVNGLFLPIVIHHQV